MLKLTHAVLYSNLLERRQDAARTLAMLSAEGPNQRHRGGSDILLHWTIPLAKMGMTVFHSDSFSQNRTFIYKLFSRVQSVFRRVKLRLDSPL